MEYGNWSLSLKGCSHENTQVGLEFKLVSDRKANEKKENQQKYKSVTE